MPILTDPVGDALGCVVVGLADGEVVGSEVAGSEVAGDTDGDTDGDIDGAADGSSLVGVSVAGSHSTCFAKQRRWLPA